MSDNAIQPSFASGELSPSLFARVDVAKYHSGAATMRNFFVDYRSGASTRAGTEFIRPTKQNLGSVRIVRFQQSVSVTFVLEFGNQYLRFISDASSIVETGFNITNIARTNPALVTCPGNNFANGDLIFVTGVQGMLQADGRYFTVRGVSGSIFTLEDSLTGAPIDSTNWFAYTGGGLAQRVYTISTPYLSSEVAMLKFSQKASVMNITHPNHPPYVLTLINATNWTLAPVTIGSSIGPPVTVIASSAPAGSSNYLIAVTSVDTSGQESAPGYVGLGSAVDVRNTVGSITVSWTAVAGAQSYNIYFTSPSLGATGNNLGFVGSASGGVVTFVNSNIAPDFGQTPPISQNPFTGVDAHPQVSSYFQQRLVYGNGGANDVDEFWMSKPGAYTNFDISIPSQDDDALTARLVSLEVNEIKSFMPMPSGLVTFTTRGVWQISGGAGGVATQGGPVTPSTLTATPQAYVGANDVPPILINYDIFFVQQKGSIVRNLSYNIYANIYTGNDVSILSSHLFYGHQILEWSYAEEPFKMIWAVRDDGTLVALTTIKEQDMYGWSRHDTLGNFLSTCTVTEGLTDAVYFVVDRPNTATGTGFTRCIERMADRTFTFGAEDAWCVDCGVKTTANTPNANLTPLATTGLAQFITNPGVFTSAMVGWIIRAGGGVATVTQFIDMQHVMAQITQPITNLLPNDPLNRPDTVPSGSWSIDKPIQQIFGLDHLEGQRVAVLADGGVVNGLVVHQGSITLPSPVTKVIAGYGFQAQLQTMYLDLGQETNTVQGKRKKINALTVRVKDSRGLKAGRTFNLLTPIKELNRLTVMGQPVALITSDERIVMDPLWDVPGQICLQVDDPVPSTVLGVIPEITIGDTAK